jgi:hypothetical protein
VEDTRVDILLLAEGLWRASDQCVNVVDNLADVVGNPSGGVRSVGATLEGDDLKIRSLPTCLRCRAHTCRIAADDDKPFFRHSEFASSM